MAFTTGTASNLRAFMAELTSFVSTSPDLVSKGHEWEILRRETDNIEDVRGFGGTTLAQVSSGIGAPAFEHVFRGDPKSAPGSVEASPSSSSCTYVTGLTTGSSIAAVKGRGAQFSLIVPSSVSRIEIGLPTFDKVKFPKITRADIESLRNASTRDFLLEGSNDLTTWTTVYSKFTSANSSPPEVFEGIENFETITLPGPSAVYKHWRLHLLRAYNNSTQHYLTRFQMFDASGKCVNHYGDEVILKGAGHVDIPVYIGFRTDRNSVADWANIFIYGFTGFNPNDRGLFSQPGGMPTHASQAPGAISYGANDFTNPVTPAWNGPMRYWISANGRHVKFVLNVGTNYEFGYAGMLLQYGTPSQYPYPLALAGSMIDNGNRGTTFRFSEATMRHSGPPHFFVDTGTSTYTSGSSVKTTGSSASMMVKSPTGQWIGVGSRTPTSTGSSGDLRRTYPVGNSSTGAYYGYGIGTTNSADIGLAQCLGGGVVLLPIVINIMELGGTSTFILGELDGVYKCSGAGVVAEDTGEFGGVTFTIFQDTFRNGIFDYWAFEHEQ